MNERNTFLLIISLFLAFYLMPVGTPVFDNALLSGFKLLREYARYHILTCIVPAFFIAGAIGVFIKKEAVLKYLGNKSKKYVAYSIAAVSGAILTVCSCTILPIFAGIRKRGAGLGPAITFLFSGPAINVAAIFLTFSVLGPNIGIARAVAAIVIAIIIGVTMALIFREKTEEGEMKFSSEEKAKVSGPFVVLFFLSMVMILIVNGIIMDVTTKYTLFALFSILTALIALLKFPKEATQDWLNETWGFTKLLVPYLFIGVFIAGFIMPLVPDSAISGLVGENTIPANIVASIFGAFMYFSTLTEIPIIQALIAKGMSQGPALALLLAGPSLSLPSMLMIRKVIGNKKTMVYVLLVVFYSALAGFIYGSL